MAIQKTVNGITFTIDPAFRTQFGPNNQPAQFSGNAPGDVGQSPIILVTPSTLISQFSIQVVGLSYTHTTIAYDNQGKVLATVKTTPSIPDDAPGIGGRSTSGIENIQITAPINKSIAKIRLIPSTNPPDFVAYNNLSGTTVGTQASSPPISAQPTSSVPTSSIPTSSGSPTGTAPSPSFIPSGSTINFPIDITVVSFGVPAYSVVPTIDPNNTFRATTIGDMYTLVSAGSGTNIIYDVGKPSTFGPMTYRIRNNTITNVLRIDLNVPSFVTVNQNSTIFINPLAQMDVIVTFNEAQAKLYSMNSVRVFSENLTFSIVPLNVTGPVLVQDNLPSLSF